MREKRYTRKAAEHTIHYKKAATCFNEALPLGNGRIGAVVYGGTFEDKISLNEDTLWGGYPKQMRKEDYPAIYQKASRLFEEGETAEAQRTLEEGFGDYLVQMYLPLADLKIRTSHDEVSHYSRMLRLDTAVHTAEYTAEEKRFTRETFVSEPYQVLAIRFQCDRDGSISFEAGLESQLVCEYATAEDACLMHGTAPNCVAEYGTFYQSTDAQIYDGKGIRYACAVTVNAKGGRVTYGKGAVKVEGADEAVLYFAVRTNFKRYNEFPGGEEYIDNCLSDVRNASEEAYDVLRRESIYSQQKLYERCEISIGSKDVDCQMLQESEDWPGTDERLKQLQLGGEDNALYALLFNFGKYLTIAGSRAGTQAMNLQGIWNDKIIPPWNSNYTLNINTEMNYWPTLALGLFECFEPFARMVQELAESGKETALAYYDTEGWVCHHSTDIWRLTHPGTNRLSGNAQWGFWNMASGWLSVMVWNYYRYTLDQEYLKTMYPIMEEAAKFYRSLLKECDGKLVLSPSTSPENNYIEDGRVHAIDKSTAMTQEILIDLFTAVSEASDILGVSNEYRELIPRLKRPHMQSDGELCEWHREHEVWDVHHRHVSHLYGLFPGCQFDEAEKEACKKVLQSRGDDGTGWSLAWKINLWARLGDGEHALRLLKNQLRLVPAEYDGTEYGGGSYPNLFCAHPPFQIDGNFGAANGIIEMLLQCDAAGNPILLPALPKAWKSGSVKGLRLPGNRKISFAWKNGKVTWSKVTE